MALGVLCRVTHSQDVDLPRIVIDRIEHDVGIAHDRKLANSGGLARPGAVGKVSKALDAAPDHDSHAPGRRPIAGVDVGEYLVELSDGRRQIPDSIGYA